MAESVNGWIMNQVKGQKVEFILRTCLQYHL